MTLHRAALFSFAQPADDPDARAGEFVPHEGGGNVASGEVLLVEAYAVMWLLAFALIFMSYRKQKALDRRVARLQDDLARARQGGERS